jgi:hypothetical protein
MSWCDAKFGEIAVRRWRGSTDQTSPASAFEPKVCYGVRNGTTRTKRMAQVFGRWYHETSRFLRQTDQNMLVDRGEGLHRIG